MPRRRLLLGTTSLLALGQAWGVEGDPDLAPTSGFTAEDGPTAVWVNPANLAYDPDPRWAAVVRVPLTTPDDDGALNGRAHALGLTAGIGGVSAALRWFHREDRADDIAIDLAAGLRLPRRLAIGGALRWSLEANARNHVAFDASAAWRPLPWFGMTLLARNIGAPGDENGAPALTGGGVALRPFGRAVIVGADVAATFDGSGPPTVSFAASTRIRPTEGLYLRARVDSQLRFAFGVEVYFGAIGGGVWLGSDAAPPGSVGPSPFTPDLIVFAGNDESREDLAPSRRAVPVIRLDRPVAYQPPRRLLGRAEPSWLELLARLDEATREPSTRAVVVSLGATDHGWARWREIRGRISALELSGRQVIVHLTEAAGTGALYAASAASSVQMHPAGVLDLARPAVQSAHFAGLLDSVGVEVDVVRSGPYKTAGEAFTEREPSEAEREQQLALLRTVQSDLVTGIAAGRGLPEDRVLALLTDGPLSAEEAVTAGLVDGLAWPDELEARASVSLGHRAHLVQPNRARPPRTGWEPPTAIAIVHIEGTIVSGLTPPAAGGLQAGGRRTGSETVVRQLQRAAEDPSVRAVVLRVDSPGGSTFASEEIWRAVKLLREQGTPVVASLGNQATSGGYYAACAADAIWAEPTTVTGSIGVIHVSASAEQLLERLGVHITTLREGPGWDPPSPVRARDAAELTRTAALVEASYRTFVARVADARKLDPTVVDGLARGRVWSGADARARGLVDHHGGLVEAVAHARALAGIPARTPIDVITLDRDPRWSEILVPDLARLRFLSASGGLPDPATAALATLLTSAITHHAGGPIGVELPEPLATLWLLLQDGSATWMIDPNQTRVTP
jgi:protease-4